jgi:hypothetical protein
LHANRLGGPWGGVQGGISYEDFIYFYQVVSTPTAAPAADQPTTIFWPLVLPSPTLPAPYLPAHISNTTSNSLAPLIHDGSKSMVKYLADILVISLKIKTGSQRGHKQLILNQAFIA